MAKKPTPTDNRRYKLHQKIKEKYTYSAKSKTVFIPFDYSVANDPFLVELRDHHRYNIQYSIINPKNK
jgi:hypothetical protein